MVTELTDQTFDEKTNNGVTFTDFWATWCGPCRMQSPVIEQLAEEMGSRIVAMSSCEPRSCTKGLSS